MEIGMILSWILWLLFVAVATFAAFWLVRQFVTQLQSRVLLQTDETLLSILNRRFASSEIDQTQFEAMKNQLS